MPVVRRSNAPRGPRFYQDDGNLMFLNVVDSMTQDGPREATDEDRLSNPQAWEIFEGTRPDPVAAFAPMVQFADPPGGRPAEKPIVAKGEKAPA
jgi:hypothetical protein